jgi:ParB family chromosome partitioning protein
MGHARALLAIESPEEQSDLAHRAAAQGLSVRQVERLVQSITSRRATEHGGGPKAEKSSGEDPNVTAATRDLEAALGTRVRIVSQSPDRGRIEIEYFSIDELDRLYNLIVGSK